MAFLRRDAIFGTVFRCVRFSFIIFCFYFIYLIFFLFTNSEEGKYTDETYFESVDDSETIVPTNNGKISTAPMSQHIVCISPGDEYRQHQIEIDEYSEDLEDDGTGGNTTYEQISNDKNIKSDNNVYILNTSTGGSNPLSDASAQNQQRQSKVYGQSHQITSVSSTYNDPDERFLLSCLPILKRLSNKKNALARLKIQQLLYDIEFEEYSEMSSH